MIYVKTEASTSQWSSASGDIHLHPFLKCELLTIMESIWVYMKRHNKVGEMHEKNLHRLTPS